MVLDLLLKIGDRDAATLVPVQQELSKEHGVVGLVLVHLLRQILVFFDLVVKHDGYFIKLYPNVLIKY